MANTYTLIEAKTLSSTTTSVTFSSIPNTYTDLLLKVSPRTNITQVAWTLRMNLNSSTSNYTNIAVQGSGSSTNSYNENAPFGGVSVGANATANTFSNIEIYIPNYTSSNYKSYSIDSVTENNATEAYATLIAGLWSDTSVISSIKFELTGATPNDFVSGSTFYLYGIKNS